MCLTVSYPYSLLYSHSKKHAVILRKSVMADSTWLRILDTETCSITFPLKCKFPCHVQSSVAHATGSSSVYFILQATSIVPNCCSETINDCSFCSKKSAQNKFPKRKKNVYLLQNLWNTTLPSFITPPSTRCVRLYIHSLNKGTFSFYSVLLIWLMRIMPKDNKKEVEWTCQFRENFCLVCCPSIFLVK